MTTNAFATRLRQERELRGWSRQYIAEQVSVHLATIGRWERGERVPHPHYRRLLCELFQKNTLELGLQDSAMLDNPLSTSDPQPEHLSRVSVFPSAQVSRPPSRSKILIIVSTLAFFVLYMLGKKK